MAETRAKKHREKRSAVGRNLLVKVRESLTSVLPISIIVLILNFTVAPMPAGTVALFVGGAVLLILGMGLFTLGADMSMMPMGESIGSQLTKSRKLLLLVGVSFLIGVIITIAEPDLQVLAEQVASVPSMTLILAVALGVGLFLVLALLRIVFQVQLAKLLIIFYIALFVLAAFVPKDFLAMSFDSGGVTTGPMTVPFILALGIGVAAVRGGKSSRDDSFGLVALCSIGPVMAVMLLGMLFGSSGAQSAAHETVNISGFGELLAAFSAGFPRYLKEVGIALLPIVAFFVIFQLVYLKLPRSQILRISVGLLYTYLGLALFMTGVNVGFMPVGNYMGQMIGGLEYSWILVPLGALMGFFVVMAEPAVHVLNEQVEEITVGAISKRSMLISLSVGVAASVGLSMLRVLTGISIWWFILPGYALALVLTFFVPKVFTAIAFDSGGVASGPMTATFLLPFAMGACASVGGNILTDAFGLVAMVAMTPLVTIQLLGLVYKLKLRSAEGAEALELGEELAAAVRETEDDIIEM